MLILYVNLVGQYDTLSNPVKGATRNSWDRKSFWFFPWGKSGVHKGIDIFAPHKTPVLSPVPGIVMGTGNNENGGNYIYVLGPKLRLYYYAHLNSVNIKMLEIVKKGTVMGAVGNTGNASLKPYHLHFSVSSLLPVFNRCSFDKAEGWKQMFYLDPAKLIAP